MVENTFSRPILSRLILVWGVFFLICFSLGYPTLNRYSPTTAGATAEKPYGSLVDTLHYADLVENGFMDTPDSIWRYRVLVPYVAKPFYALAKGNIGSWNPVYFGLLVANSIFIASAAILLFMIGSAVTGSATVGFISSLLLLSHFNISNLYLAGLVDSSELFLMILTAWLLLNNKWQMLPLVAVLAFLSRETTVVFTSGLAAGWLIVEAVRNGLRRPQIYRSGGYLLVAIVIGLGGLLALRYVGTSALVPGWLQRAGSDPAAINLSTGMSNLVTSKTLLYSFVWLLPLGLAGLKSVSGNWVWASVMTTGGAFLMIIFMDAGDNAARPLFNTLGPVLLVGAAVVITRWLKLERSP